MQAFRDRKVQFAGLAGISLTAAFLVAHRMDAIAPSDGPGDLASSLSQLRAHLPIAQVDGSVLENLSFDGQRVTLEFVADERIDLRLLRDGERERKCGEWRSALRSREATGIEYRYRQGGAASSIYLDRAVCG